MLDKEGMSLFLARWVEGWKVTDIAQELGVRPETRSKGYRKKSLSLTTIELVRNISKKY